MSPPCWPARDSWNSRANIRKPGKLTNRVLKRYPLFTPAHKPLGLLLSDHLNDPGGRL